VEKRLSQLAEKFLIFRIKVLVHIYQKLRNSSLFTNFWTNPKLNAEIQELDRIVAKLKFLKVI